MKKSLTILMALLLMTVMPLTAKVTHLLPTPKSVNIADGSFALNRPVQLTDATGSKLLENFLTENGCTITDGAAASVTVEIVGSIDGAYDYTLHGYENEAYTIDITANTIKITAVTNTGVIRAAQTLVQLAEDSDGSLELVSIKDWPSFKLRGYAHDVGRSFIEFETLKKQIDLLSRFKVNTFHWHLTENQAWRFEVNAYPQLTESGSMTRFAGKYYTQEQCKELEEYAAERGVIIIPEIDMPGHSEAFVRAMNFDMQSDKGVEALQVILEEVVKVFPKAPYIHIGADEKSITYNNFLGIMTNKVHSLGKKAICWNPISGVNITSNLGFDMTQMWSSSGKNISGVPDIDCRYNYTNHFDVFADLVGIYKSNIYYEQQGSSEIAGTISFPWNDRKTPTEEDIIKQNNFYANVIASAERAWKGGGKQYIEVGGTTLPNSGEEYEEFADFERRFLFHKANSLKSEPIPYVKQTNVRWRITEPYPNNGDMTAQFPPETETGELQESYTYDGTTYGSGMATGAGIYLRHTWGNNTVPTYYGSTNYSDCTAYAWTYVYSENEQTVGAQIEFQNYGRSEKDSAPDAGKWDRKGSKIWINDQEILPPTWDNTGVSINNEVDLKNENFTARTPLEVTLKQGWNKVFIKLPYVSADGVRLNKWMFTCVFTDTEGKNAIDNLIYSPNKCLDEEADMMSGRIAEIKNTISGNVGELPGNYPVSIAEALNAKISEIEATLSQQMSDEERDVQSAALEQEYTAFLAALETAEINQPQEDVLYRMYTPLRGNRYPTSKGANAAIIGEVTPTDASVWRFVKRDDGTYNIVNANDGTYISPASNNNTALNGVSNAPTNGWQILPANTAGLVIIVSGETQFNQTNNSSLGYKVYNWGYSSNVTNSYNTTDTGCQYQFEIFDGEITTPEPDEETDAPFKTTTISNGEFASSTTWYLMRLGESGAVLSDNEEETFISVGRATTTYEDKDLWCFVGDAQNGYAIYNKQTGTTKVLASSSTMGSLAGYGGTGGSTYPTMQTATSLPNGYIGKWDFSESTAIANIEGWYMKLHGTNYAVNNFGGIGKLAFWAEGTDAGSTVYFETATISLEILASKGHFTASNANGTWHSKWESSEVEGFSLAASANNMTTSNDFIAGYSGLSQSSTYTLTAPEGYVITGISFNYKNTDTGTHTINLSIEGQTITSNSTEKSFAVEIEDPARIITFTQTGVNKGITFSNFIVTMRPDTAEPEPFFEVFPTPTTSAIPYRIPAITTASNGNIIAVADYRHSRADIGMATNGRIDLRARISKDNGETWGDIFDIVQGQGADGVNTPGQMYVGFGDPCIVADRESNRVLVISCSGNVSFPNGTRNNHQGIAHFYSEDNGETWSVPVDRSESIYSQFDNSPYGPVRAMFVGSGKISQSKYIKVKDYYRLYCSVLVKDVNGSHVNFVLYSDDFGESWTVLGGPDVAPIPGSADEPKADELPDGSVIVSSRVTGGRHYNIFSYTNAEKAEGSWGTYRTSNSGTNGVVAINNSTNGEIMTVPATRKTDGKPVYLFLQSVPFGSGRANVGIYYKELESLNDFINADSIAFNWDGSHQSSYLGSAYSTFCLQADNTLAFLYEEDTYGTSGGGYTIVYKNYSIEQITDSAYTYNPNLDAMDFVAESADIKLDILGISEENNYVGCINPEASLQIASTIEAYKEAPSYNGYQDINKAVQNAEKTEIIPNAWYRLRNTNRSNATLYIKPEASRLTVGTSNLNNADQLMSFIPATDEGTYYLYNGNYQYYLGPLGANETQPAVFTETSGAGIWSLITRSNGKSSVVCENKTGSNVGLHLAGDNARLVPWTADSDASLWYIEPVDEYTVTINEFAAVNYPFAYNVPEGVNAYTAGATSTKDGVTYVTISQITDGFVPANTAVILEAENGSYDLAVSNSDAASLNTQLSGTLKAASVSGSNVYTLNGNVLNKRTAASGTIAANTAYYTTESDATELHFEKVATGIEDIIIEGGESLKFYDLNGREVSKPTRGIYITSKGDKVFVK